MLNRNLMEGGNAMSLMSSEWVEDVQNLGINWWEMSKPEDFFSSIVHYHIYFLLIFLKSEDNSVYHYYYIIIVIMITKYDADFIFLRWRSSGLHKIGGLISWRGEALVSCLRHTEETRSRDWGDTLLCSVVSCRFKRSTWITKFKPVYKKICTF